MHAHRVSRHMDVASDFDNTIECELLEIWLQCEVILFRHNLGIANDGLVGSAWSAATFGIAALPRLAKNSMDSTPWAPRRKEEELSSWLP